MNTYVFQVLIWDKSDNKRQGKGHIKQLKWKKELTFIMSSIILLFL